MRLAIAILISSAAWAQTFEVASVRIVPEKERGFTNFSPYGTEKFIARNVSLEILLEIAFGVEENQIVGPGWMRTEHYEVNAKAADGVALTYEQVQPRLRKLLEERFLLATHSEPKESNGYALVIAKDGPKLQPTAGISAQGNILPGGLRFKNVSTDTLASALSRPVGRPVIDKTGLTGKYDVTLDYAPPDAADSPLPSMFTALQEKLGLKLEPQKVTRQMLVIDRVERIPTEN